MGQLHVFFFPLMAYGHMIPTLDMAKLFSSRGVKTTIITTPLNAPVFTNTIKRTKPSGIEIGLRIIKFPASEAGLPEGTERADQITSDQMLSKFGAAATMLKDQLENLLEECRPDCLIADMSFPWATDSAAKFDIPRLVFHGTGFFALCAVQSIRVHKPYKHVSSDSDLFVVPNLPHEIRLTRTQVAGTDREDSVTEFNKIFNQIRNADLTSYGVIFNSFYELEPDYADHYRNVLKMKAWHVGPVSLCNTEMEDKVERGKKAAIDENECLKWLDSKKTNSVIYICFGSTTHFAASQLNEIALALEGSGQEFIWVVRKSKEEEEEEEEEENQKWLPEGFEERIKGTGLIIRGWAPQVLILDHEAVGGFMTHCGWNSTLEGVCAGVPMVTWPTFAEQFYNEKLVTEILRIGVGVGAKEWSRMPSDSVKMEAIKKAVKQVMVGEEAEEMRGRAMALKEMSRKAVEEGGSSYCDLKALIEELSSYRS